jgi:hypothetical protein
MTVKERINEFIKYKGIKARAFCSSIDVSFSYVNSIRKSIQPEKLKKITEVYPELNPIWLMTGEGEMIMNGNINNVIDKGNTSVAGNGNRATNNDIAGLIELQKGYQDMLKERDGQINRLLSIVEKLSGK